MGFETISDEYGPDYEVWTCETCRYSLSLVGVGGDVAECPGCLQKEYSEEISRSERFTATRR